MSQYARVHSTDAVKKFRASLIGFAEEARIALGEAEAEIQRANTWLRYDREPYWKREHAKRYEQLLQAKAAVQHKKLYKSATGGQQSAVEEEKALAKATARYEESETKLNNIRTWLRRLEEERFLYKSQTQRLARRLETEIPKTTALIDLALDSIEDYMNVASASPTTQRTLSSMSRHHSEIKAEQDAEAARQAALIAERDRLLITAPPVDERDALPPEDTAPSWNRNQPLTLPVFDPQPQATERVAADDIVVMHPAVSSARRVFFARTHVNSPGDSGWYIGVAQDDTEPNEDNDDAVELVAITVEALLRKRGDLRSLLDLPFGWLIIEGTNGFEYAVADDGTLHEADSASSTEQPS